MAKSPNKKKPNSPRKAKVQLAMRKNLSALISTARKILRKDKGLNGDVVQKRMVSGCRRRWNGCSVDPIGVAP